MGGFVTDEAISGVQEIAPSRQGGTVIRTELKRTALAIGLIFLALAALAGNPAAAPSAELAIKCRDMMIKAYPPVRPGSPHGNAQKEREYFRTCIARNGKMDESPASTVGRGTEPSTQNSNK
jgi:hypothetical protein